MLDRLLTRFRMLCRHEQMLVLFQSERQLVSGEARRSRRPSIRWGRPNSTHLQPFKIDVGRAAAIAEWLRRNGHPACTADVVTAELAGPGNERTIIGRFASAQLYQAGWRPDHPGVVLDARLDGARALGGSWINSCLPGRAGPGGRWPLPFRWLWPDLAPKMASGGRD